jgi:hypothetical protein
MTTYRIKEVKYYNGVIKFYPESVDADVDACDEDMDWQQCFGTQISGYYSHQEALNCIVFDKAHKTNIMAVTIHKVEV